MSHLHCDSCLKRFSEPNIEGRILSDSTERYYHRTQPTDYSAYPYSYPTLTACGREADWFDNASGTYGIEISEDDFLRHTRRGKTPCPKCWGRNWKAGLTERILEHGGRARASR